MNFNFSRFYFDAQAKKPLILSTDQRYIDLWGGRARGASYAGSDSLLFALVTEPYFRGYIMRQVFNDIRDSIWKDLMDRVQDSEINTSLFHINECELDNYKKVVIQLCNDGWVIEHENYVLKNMSNQYYWRLVKHYSLLQ
jgi:phage terminase large subunit